MFAAWIQIAELALLPLGLGVGYVAGRVSRREEQVACRPENTITHPGLAPEYPARHGHTAPYPPTTWDSSRVPGHGPMR